MAALEKMGIHSPGGDGDLKFDYEITEKRVYDPSGLNIV
jgi:hypothetical protein